MDVIRRRITAKRLGGVALLLLVGLSCALPSGLIGTQQTSVSTITPLAGGALESGRVVTVESVEGTVEVRVASATDFGPVQQGSTLAAGDELRTGADGRAVLAMDDDTVIVVAENSSFVVAALEEGVTAPITRYTLNAGEVFSIREEPLPPGAIYEVETPAGVAGIRGTGMGTAHDLDSGLTEVTCLFGECSATAGDAQVEMVGNQGIGMTEAAGFVGAITPLTPEQRLRWSLALEDAADAGQGDPAEARCGCEEHDLVCDDGSRVPDFPLCPSGLPAAGPPPPEDIPAPEPPPEEPDQPDQPDQPEQPPEPPAQPEVEECTLDAAFVSDVTIPDDTVVAPVSYFTKTWRIQNSGTCDWGDGFQWVFVADDPMGVSSGVAVPPTVAGTMVDISVDFLAPEFPGTYVSTWQMRAPDGTLFGDRPYVRVVVEEPPPEEPPTEEPPTEEPPTEEPPPVCQMIPPEPIWPIGGKVIYELWPGLEWRYNDKLCQPEGYRIDLATDPSFKDTSLSGGTGKPSTVWAPGEPLEACTTYYWRVAGVIGFTLGPWSETESFTIYCGAAQ
jgi:hypothetical protein